MYVLFRLLMIHVGLVAACLAASTAFMFIETLGVTPPYELTPDQVRYALVIHVLIVAGIGLFYSYLPALALAIVTEVFGLRSVLVFAIAGLLLGVFAATGWLPQWVTMSWDGESLTKEPLKAFPAIGAVGGFAYWLIAGRRAGLVREPTAPLQSEQGT